MVMVSDTITDPIILVRLQFCLTAVGFPKISLLSQSEEKGTGGNDGHCVEYRPIFELLNFFEHSEFYFDKFVVTYTN